MELHYTYEIEVVSVYDADTIRANVNLGFGNWMKGLNGKGQSFRLARIDAPEVRGSEKIEGKESRDRLRELIEGKYCRIESIKSKTDKYGRYVIELYASDYGNWFNVNDWLVENKLALYADY